MLFSMIYCIIVPCLPFFEIIFYFFLWKLLMLYVICVIFDDLLYNCPLFTFFAIFFLWKLLLLYVICVIFDDFLHICPLLPFLFGGGPSLENFFSLWRMGHFLINFKVFYLDFFEKMKIIKILCWFKKSYFWKIPQKMLKPKK